MNATTEQEIRESFRRDFNPDGTPRDYTEQRAGVIAHAFAAMRRDNATEADRNIVELQVWLTAHEPRPIWTPEQHQARADRLANLDMWIKKALFIPVHAACPS